VVTLVGSSSGQCSRSQPEAGRVEPTVAELADAAGALPYQGAPGRMSEIAAPIATGIGWTRLPQGRAAESASQS